ncbi:septum formation initiator family protein [Streptomyces sp. LX-29]|uniref:septum formation initiator family protein n=1 Tax=Streptomyces sp. LX-29 TaxID=2900152 RepID=UPI00240E021B|nr:septum formation initiator family protein [Streptomyces sp. LX-29]WFB10026.1 septum formation initiator family protein [Streptomyces sp. LX-29]
MTAPGAAAAKRTPFVFLVVVLLGSGLIGLLVLNSALNQGSFELSRLERQATELTDERQALQQEVDELSAPDALERRARELGMVPGGNPVFLEPDGTVRGVPSPAAGGGPAVLDAPAAALPTAPPPPPPPAARPQPGPVRRPDLGEPRRATGGLRVRVAERARSAPLAGRGPLRRAARPRPGRARSHRPREAHPDIRQVTSYDGPARSSAPRAAPRPPAR